MNTITEKIRLYRIDIPNGTGEKDSNTGRYFTASTDYLNQLVTSNYMCGNDSADRRILVVDVPRDQALQYIPGGTYKPEYVLPAELVDHAVAFALPQRITRHKLDQLLQSLSVVDLQQIIAQQASAFAQTNPQAAANMLSNT